MVEFNDKRFAILANDLCFSYSKSDLILNKLNISVREAHIYGLLGPSGCGKTTLLKCILGRLQPSRGEIQIFGAKPGSPECHIPGAGVGYMPQEYGLCSVFTIEEIVTYFGKIYSMNKIDIKEKFNEITKLLKLPKNDKLIDKLSGGQKRRISLACALIHSPPLLILDEPTVGTDPTLRKSIWSHLLSLCKRGVTVILTTHYIEEARNADVVAFMRSGKILAENEPNILLNKYMSTTLEEVFLKLCDSENNNEENLYTNRSQIQNEIIDDTNEEKDGIYLKSVKILSDVKNKTEISEKIANDQDRLISNLKIDHLYKKELVNLRASNLIDKCSALSQKNMKRLSRNWIQFIFFIIFPAIELGLLLYSVGDRPTNLKIAVFDDEVLNNVSDGWGHLFVNSLDKNVFKVIDFDSYEKAMDSVERGHTYAVIDINYRFSNTLRLRTIYGSDADEETLDESQIRVHIDWSQQLVALQIERHLYEAMLTFAKEVANRSHIDAESLKIPLKFEEPVYGTRKESLSDFVLPGAFIIILFYGITIVSANLILEEQKDGILERSLVAGITALDFLLSHALTQFLILCLQLVFMILIPWFVLNRGLTGSSLLIIALLVSQGFCGVSFGLMVAAVCRDLLYSSMFVTASLIINMVVSGVFWPIENMPFLIQFCGQFTPNTLPIFSLRNILYREWDLSYYEVYIGFVVTYLWFGLFLIIALIFIRRSY